MRVLLVTSAYPTGVKDPRGVFIHRLARALCREGAEVAVIAPGAPTAQSSEIRDGVRIERPLYWIPRWQGLATGLGGIIPNLRSNPLLLLQVPPLVLALTWRAIRMGAEFDVIHGHWTYPAGVAGLLAARRHRIPFIVTSHGGDLNLARKSRFLRSVSGWISRAADTCIAVSEALVEDFLALGVAPERAMFIPLGVEAAPDAAPEGEDAGTPYGRYLKHGGFRLLYVGSLIPRKSVDTLLEAYRELEERGHRLACAVVGSGSTEHQLREMAEKHGSSNVFFLGNKPPTEVPKWLAAAHALVLPSLSEGRPVAIMEAMASGVPVVATDIPGNRELVHHDETGLLFPPRDARNLADCIEKLIQDESLRHAMGQRARARVEGEGLLVADVARTHLALYERVCHRAARPDGEIDR